MNFFEASRRRLFMLSSRAVYLPVGKFNAAALSSALLIFLVSAPITDSAV